MDVTKAIKKRRSIRKYSPKAVPLHKIMEILDAARLAPSGCNVQPTRFILIRSARMKEKLKKKKVFPQDWVYTAPLIIVYCGNPKDYGNFEGAKYQQEDGTLPTDITKVYPYFSDPEERTLKDLSISSAFTMLRAVELGLGTCYIGLVDRVKIKTILKIPKNFIIPFALTIGFPAEKPHQRDRKSLKKLILKIKNNGRSLNYSSSSK
ncbi:MAG: nitroreductase family protein [Candidatus Altiarchaeota archaeon]